MLFGITQECILSRFYILIFIYRYEFNLYLSMIFQLIIEINKYLIPTWMITRYY